MIPGVRLIYVDGSSRGLVDLEQTYRVVSGMGVGDHAELSRLLLREALRANYIPGSMAEKYARALLIDYRLWRGELNQDEARRASGAIEVRVLGMGCPNCDRLEQAALQVLDELGIAADFEHLRDPAAIAAHGPVATPALVVNGTVVSSGLVPSLATLRERIRQVLARPGDVDIT